MPSAFLFLFSLTIVIKMPNSGLSDTLSPSVKINFFFLSFFAIRTMYICCAATDNTGSSIRLNSSKQPQEPDCAKPKKIVNNYLEHSYYLLYYLEHKLLNIYLPINKIKFYLTISL